MFITNKQNACWNLNKDLYRHGSFSNDFRLISLFSSLDVSFLMWHESGFRLVLPFVLAHNLLRSTMKLIFSFSKIMPLASDRAWIKQKKKAETSRDGHSNYLRNRRKETLKAKLNIIVCDSKLIFIIIDDSPDPTEYLYKLFIRFPLIFILLSWCSLFDRFMSFTINLLKIAPPETARESRPRWSEFIQETTLRTNV